MKKILFTSVCRPLGPKYGDAPSVGYELLFGQVTRAQGLFSPRAVHLHFSLEYIAENIEAPAMVLQYPSRAELIRELKKGYDYICVSFLLAVFHRMKDVVSLIKTHSPGSKIVLGGYGAVLSDDALRPYSDYICREEGVAFMRRLLGEPPISMPYRHPLIVSRLKIFSKQVSQTGMIFAGLGCPNGCDFCCTSHFFKRRHIRLLPEGKDIYNVIERYMAADPNTVFTILDEDFLLNKARAMQFRECVLKGGKTVSIFAFASVRALSLYSVEEIMEMGIDGVWIGYEGTRSGYAKQQGRPVEELFRDLRDHGITILASMIVGLPYQDSEVIRQEFDGLMALKPSLAQFLIYGPTPGTPFYERILREGLLHRDLADDREEYYRKCSGFAAMVRHPRMAPNEIEAIQNRCFKEDYERLGPSLFRVIDVYRAGYHKLRNSQRPFLRQKSSWFASQVRKSYPIFLAGRLLGPTSETRRWIADLERKSHEDFGAPRLIDRLSSIAALALALWTGLKLKMGLLGHPALIRHAYRMPSESPRPSRIWRHLRERVACISVEMRPEKIVWVRLKRLPSVSEAHDLGARIRQALEFGREHLVLDLTESSHLAPEAAEKLAASLKHCRDKVRLVAPAAFAYPRAAIWLAVLSLYR
ncbi:MAG: B12-binding domain-containing radical SAM protein [Elusimicrobiota bacterium]